MHDGLLNEGSPQQLGQAGCKLVKTNAQAGFGGGGGWVSNG